MSRFHCPNCKQHVGLFDFFNTPEEFTFSCKHCQTDLNLKYKFNHRLLMYTFALFSIGVIAVTLYWGSFWPALILLPISGYFAIMDGEVKIAPIVESGFYEEKEID